ncbi:MAG: hypothetical protein R2788_07950 [Saprospiraceae bacterium]
MNKSVIAIAVLLLAFLVGSFYFMSQNSKLNEKTNHLTSKVDSLTTLKFDLLDEIDSLRIAFAVMANEKDSVSLALSAEIEEARKIMDRQKSELRIFKRKTATEIKGLNKEIGDLGDIREKMERVISQLQTEKEELLNQNMALTEQLEDSEERNRVLAYQVEELEQLNLSTLDELRSLRATAFQATNFNVEVQNKSDKPTTNKNRAKTIKVGIDINNVPSQYQGEQSLYLVIKDARGIPIESLNPTKTTIKSPSRDPEIVPNGAIHDVVGGIATGRIQAHDIVNDLTPGITGWRCIPILDC